MPKTQKPARYLNRPLAALADFHRASFRRPH
nr:MAG TPA: hypothetical protein [Caudoviricetes sp.]DAY05838.1 MAG TPA: hypothetical protein [Caudoviricetes sp.]